MKETQNTEETTNYIDLSNDSQSVGNIFNELSGEMGELDFSEKKTPKIKSERNIIITMYSISGKAFTLALILAIILSIDVFVRTATDNRSFAHLPICQYLVMGMDDYDNNECLTLPMILVKINTEKEKIEKSIVLNLTILIPKLMQSLDIINSPKVQFIQEHTGDSRYSIVDMFDRFVEVKNKTSYQGEDIECKNILVNETGKFSISCQVFGGPIIAPAGLTTKTSREVALGFLERLGDDKSVFQILSYPKILDISAFNSTDGFKAVFSTQTSLNLTLQYLPANKM